MILRSLVVVAFVALAVAAPAAALTTPKLSITVSKKGDAALHVSIGGTTRGDAVTVEIEHAVDDDGFEPWKDVDHAKKKSTVKLADLDYGVHVWRARALDSDETTAWSNIVDLEIEEPSEPSGDPPLEVGQHECPAGWIAEVLRITNEQRRAYGLAPLRDHPLLAKAARMRAITMAKKGSLTHDGWVAVIQATGYVAWTLGENIAMGYNSPASVMTGWMNSSGHRANILRSTYRDSGVGCVLDSRGRPWWAHDFGA